MLAHRTVNIRCPGDALDVALLDNAGHHHRSVDDVAVQIQHEAGDVHPTLVPSSGDVVIPSQTRPTELSIDRRVVLDQHMSELRAFDVVVADEFVAVAQMHRPVPDPEVEIRTRCRRLFAHAIAYTAPSSQT